MRTIDTISGGGASMRSSGEGSRQRPRILVAAATKLLIWLEYCRARQRSRRALLELTDEQLKDIGLSRCDAEREGSRLFWD